MKNQYAESHPDMTFEKMDLLNMSYSEGSFSCFLDKGTLDALMSGNDEESRERALKMFRVTHNSVFDLAFQSIIHV